VEWLPAAAVAVPLREQRVVAVRAAVELVLLVMLQAPLVL
jgi:hypothetical protein